jgi:sorting nexin-32
VYRHCFVYFQELLYRRLRCLANYENANRNLDKARLRNREVNLAEKLQQTASEKFDSISKLAKQGK